MFGTRHPIPQIDRILRVDMGDIDKKHQNKRNFLNKSYKYIKCFTIIF